MVRWSDNAHRQLIGYIGLVLPFLLILIVLWRDGTGLWQNLSSISAYYYTGAVAAFVGMLVSLALFLITYRGYDDKKFGWVDRCAARAAGIAALLVAFFPTQEPAGVSPLSWWTATIGVIHYAAAIILFLMFAVFALWLFRLTEEGVALTADKERRNQIYLACGIVIVICIGWAGLNGWSGREIFWPESIALIAFAISWLVKGYALRTIVDAARSLKPGA